MIPEVRKQAASMWCVVRGTPSAAASHLTMTNVV